MNEREGLVGLLGLLAVAYVLKTVIFAFLAHEMAKQEAKTSLGNALTQHYLSLSLQAICLACLYAYYASVTGHFWGGGSPSSRYALYIATTGCVIWVVISGIRLLKAYFTEKGRNS